MKMNLGSDAVNFVKEFIAGEKLPASYDAIARNYFVPLASRIERMAQKMDHVPVIGINGGQGTGKSTCSALIAGLLELRGVRTLVLSIDDLYFSKAVRRSLATEVHPLLMTRGVPGTHEMVAFEELVAAVRSGDADVVVPRFDKGEDDRCAEGTVVPAGSVDVILFEGWCIGATAQSAEELAEPCNEFEREFDADGVWRTAVNDQLAGAYADAFAKVDYLVMLKPPCFEVIYEWRGEQEAKLRAKLMEQGRSDSEAMDEQQLARFIAHYERLTRHMLGEMPARADEVFMMDESHGIFSTDRKTESERYLVSTDLDASLLDESYSWEAARPALTALANADAKLVLNSSKTVSEMKQLAIDLADIDGIGECVLVAENGGALAVPTSTGYQITSLGSSRARILSVAHGLRAEHTYQFTGFSDMTAEDVVELTGLGHDAALMAMDRESTEPILWNDTEERWTDFASALEQQHVRAVRGGRFIHLMGLTDKAEGMDAALDVFQKQDSATSWTVIALGDSPNDLGMLSAADIAVAIPNPAHGQTLEPFALQCVRPENSGPTGWNEAVLEILNEKN